MPEKDYISLEALGNYAQTCAAGCTVSGYMSGRREAVRLKKALGCVMAWKPDKDKTNRHRTAEEWIQDNRFIIQREALDAAAQLRTVRCLSKCGTGSMTAHMADKLLSVSNNAVDIGRFEVFVDGWCQDAQLTEGDMSCLVASLKAAAVQRVAMICATLARGCNDDPAKDLSALIGTLSALAAPGWWEAVERCDRVDRILSADPTGEYSSMDDDTRRLYRHRTAQIARRRGISQQAAAVWAISEAKRQDAHVGSVLFDRDKLRKRCGRRMGLYISCVIVLTFAFSLALGFILKSAAAALLLLIPMSELVKNFADLLVLRIVRPTQPMRLELKDGIPRKGRTLCVISALMMTADDGPRYARLLEEYAIANRDAGQNLTFGILADLKEHSKPEHKEDAALLKAAANAIEQLNRRTGGGFVLLCRPRSWSESSRRWMGRERKRGAIEELVGLLSGGASSLRLSGDTNAVKDIKYILTLDADTRLTPGAATRLVGAALHPMNRAVTDAETGRVIQGYGILQPRISVDLEAAHRSWFSRLFAGKGGCDPYSGVCSDLYQDLCGKGSFNGKGLIDVRAYSVCLEGRFPSERILSHDLLEGAFLGCRYISDVELTDGFPTTPASWYARQERWIRGDWQAAHWLRQRVMDGRGRRVINRLSDGDKWKLLDNLRRSIVPVFSFAAIIIGLFSGPGDLLITAAVAAGCLLSGHVLCLASGLRGEAVTKNRRRPESERFIPECAAAMAVKLCFLPYEAWVCAAASVTAMYRVLISKRDLLKWITAEQSEMGKKHSVKAYCRRMWPCVSAGMCGLVGAKSAWLAILPAVWLAAPLLAALLCFSHAGRNSLRQDDKKYIIDHCRRAYVYYTDTGATDNWLPPDHRQEQPAAGTAHRTSPTNIGMALLSHIAAADMGITGKNAAAQEIAKTLTTLERLPRWRGHLYNWYDTRSLSVIGGAYVSTVDSGNLAACLAVLAVALREFGREDLAQHAEKIAYSMDFTPLYDKSRHLFYTGWDTLADIPSESRYDLLASEARLTSYFAIATGQIPLRHWRTLGRTHLASGRHSGLASWTGTMFEYFMPELLLKTDRSSMIYEGLRFCLKEQMAVQSPWGESESSFYEFDNARGYCYKAHGVQSLAINRQMGRDRVISPYSSFLVLGMAGRRAADNLRRLEDEGLCGRYGFYEAADYTPSRQDRSDFMPVRTFMAHHIGMSIVAADNAVNGNLMVRRFMSIPQMAAFRPLLQEKGADDAVILTRRPEKQAERPPRVPVVSWQDKHDGTDPLSPRCTLLSNGVYSTLLCDTGVSRSMLGDMELTRFLPQVTDGFGLAAMLRRGDEILPLTQAPWFDGDTSYRFSADLRQGCIEAQRGGLAASMCVTVPELECGELRSFTVNGQEKGELIIIMRPVLMPPKDYEAHPAFARLMLDYRKIDNGVLIRRRPGGKKPAKWLCIRSDTAMCLCPSWEEALGRGYVPTADFTDSPAAGPLPDGGVVISLPISAAAPVLLAMTAGDSDEDAVLSAEKIIQGKAGSSGRTAQAAAARMGLDEERVAVAMELLSQLCFVTPAVRSKRELLSKTKGSKEQLWPFGISGDYPIAAYAAHEDPAAQLRCPAAIHGFLTSLGVGYDLALLVKDGGDYMRPGSTAVRSLLEEMDMLHTLGKNRGIHIIDMDAEDAAAVVAASVPHRAATEAGRKTASLSLSPGVARAYPRFSCNDKGVYSAVYNGVLPPRAYSHVLSNGSFGYIATECGSGHMWHKNAREGKITPWLNDRLASIGPERLCLARDERQISLFAADDGFECRVRYGLGFARWEKAIGSIKTDVTVFVTEKAAVRVISVKITGDISGAVLEYSARLAGGSENLTAVYTAAEREANYFRFSAPVGGDGAGFAFSEQPLAFTCDEHSYLSGCFDSQLGPGCVPCCAVRLPVKDEIIIAAGCCDKPELLGFAQPANAALELARVKQHWHDALCNNIQVKTPDKDLDNYLNGWAMYQAYVCRMLARAGIDQCGGAYGFRDQLQDCRALIWTAPKKTREHILLAASRQFKEGDVQHWWHPDDKGGKGVRTRYSDDLLWLPFVLAEYCEKTGDKDICALPVKWLASAPLSADEKDRYEHAPPTDEESPLIDHALRAIECVQKRGRGEHGLLLMGSGDWNDGMDLSEDGKQAESIWLSCFASVTAQRMARLCTALGMTNKVAALNKWAQELNKAVENTWRDERYPRAFRPDGSVLGYADSPECALDSISQSFAHFAGVAGDKTRAALMTAYKGLCNDGVARLFKPAFDGGVKDPGYIQRYYPGFRENGGQYTHAAIWLAMALLQSGKSEEGAALLLSLLPSKKDPAVYKGEPYVLAGDVSAAEGMIGRVGWTWYTGSAAWYYTTAVEELLGIKLKNGRVFIEPKLPYNWPGYEAQVCGHSVSVTRDSGGELRVLVDGEPAPSEGFEQ